MPVPDLDLRVNLIKEALSRLKGKDPDVVNVCTRALSVIDDLLFELHRQEGRRSTVQKTLLPAPPVKTVTRGNAAALVWAHTTLPEDAVSTMYGIGGKYVRSDLIPLSDAVDIASKNTIVTKAYWQGTFERSLEKTT